MATYSSACSGKFKFCPELLEDQEPESLERKIAKRILYSLLSQCSLNHSEMCKEGSRSRQRSKREAKEEKKLKGGRQGSA